MPCDTYAKTQREQQLRDEAVKKLEADIAAGRVTVVKNLAGEVSISNWSAQQAKQVGWCEGCALATLAGSTNWAVKAKLGQMGVTKGKSFVAASHNGGSGDCGTNSIARRKCLAALRKAVS